MNHAERIYLNLVYELEAGNGPAQQLHRLVCQDWQETKVRMAMREGVLGSCARLLCWRGVLCTPGDALLCTT